MQSATNLGFHHATLHMRFDCRNTKICSLRNVRITAFRCISYKVIRRHLRVCVSLVIHISAVLQTALFAFMLRPKPDAATTENKTCCIMLL
jgi:hypothetical protein